VIKRSLFLIPSVVVLTFTGIVAGRKMDNLPPVEVRTQPDKVVWRPVSARFPQDWMEYECYLPRNGRYDFAPEIVIDGKTEGGISSGGIPGGTRCVLRFRFGTDDDRRTKQILKAQNIPFDEKLVTFTLEYHLSTGQGGASSTAVKSIHVPTTVGSGTLMTTTTVRKPGEAAKFRAFTFIEPGKDTGYIPAEPQSSEENERRYTEAIVKAGGHRVVFQCRILPSRMPAL
jgi:hypothetical protein